MLYEWVKGEPEEAGYYWCDVERWRNRIYTSLPVVMRYEGKLHKDGSENSMPYETVASDEMFSYKDLGSDSWFMKIDIPELLHS